MNFENFAQIDGAFIGKVNISVMDGLGNDQETVMLEGNIDSFAIGGQELFIDDICLEE